MAPLRILCLHDFAQSEALFGNRLRAVRRVLRELADLKVTEGLHVVPKTEFTDDTKAWFYFSLTRKNEYAVAMERSEAEYIYWEKTIEALQAYIKAEGPFDGLLGLGQGAVVGAILAAAHEHAPALGIPAFRFALLAGGFMSPQPANESLRWFCDLGYSDINCPSVHMVGEADETVLPEKSVELAKLFVGAQLIHHAGGHSVPARRDDLQPLTDFLQHFADTDNGNSTGGEPPKHFAEARVRALQERERTASTVSAYKGEGPEKSQGEKLFDKLTASQEREVKLRAEKEELLRHIDQLGGEIVGAKQAYAAAEEASARALAAKQKELDEADRAWQRKVEGAEGERAKVERELERVRASLVDVEGRIVNFEAQNDKLVTAIGEERDRTAAVQGRARHDVQALEGQLQKAQELAELFGAPPQSPLPKALDFSSVFAATATDGGGGGGGTGVGDDGDAPAVQVTAAATDAARQQLEALKAEVAALAKERDDALALAEKLTRDFSSAVTLDEAAAVAAGGDAKKYAQHVKWLTDEFISTLRSVTAR